MTKFYTTCLLLFLFSTLLAQNRERTISGTLKSNDDGSPLPGVSIVIKGTTIGTTTDVEGRYSLSVPIGSVLVFSFIGMQTREVLVTETSLQPVNRDIPIRIKSTKGDWSPSIFQDTLQTQPGVTTLTFNTPSYQLRNSTLVPTDIVSIRKAWWPSSWNSQKKFVVNTNSEQYTPKGLRIQFSNAIGFNAKGKLPELQSSYSQGRNINGSAVWQGPDQQETMSWGPSIKTLEYTGSAYPYNRNGTITTAGNGNGLTVGSFHPYHFFQTGVSTSTDMSLWFPGISRSTTNLELSRKRNEGIVATNESKFDNLSLIMKRINFSQRLKGDVSFLFHSSEGHLMNRGSNMSNLMGSIMRTAPTFDNSNGYARKAAADNLLSYQLSNGSVRSTAPGFIDNPYGLVAQLPDQEGMQRWMTSWGLSYQADKLQTNLSSSFEKQVSNVTHGVAPGLSSYVTGRRTKRHEERNDAGINLLSTYKFDAGDQNVSFSLGYQFKQEVRNVSRADGFHYIEDTFHSLSSADSLTSYEFSLTRNIHEVLTKLQYQYNGFDVHVNNRNYFSNTLSKHYVNLFPSLIVKVDLDQLLYIDFLDELEPFVSLSRTLRESPALFGNSAMLSTSLKAQQYNTYFENKEIVWNSQLKPETEVKFETGLRATAYFNVTLDFSYYNNTTFGLILPLLSNSQPVLQNVAKVNNRGANASLAYTPWSYNDDVNWGFSIRWTKYNSMVTGMEVPDTFVPLAGFSDIQTVVAKDQPLGAIYGTTFLKDEEGKKIIDDKGFPIVDTQLRKIGNSLPQYLISLEPYITLKKRFRFGFILDFKKGGQVWNGTRAALNYYGRSQESADQRNTGNYIFDGVTSRGVVNTVPVDFYNPSLPLQENRWVRYGFSGVGEEHVEDASWIRLNEVSLSHKFYPIINGSKKEVAVSFIGKNLFLITPYSGVDPGTALYSYSTGSGLDLFNAPSLKSYNFLITIKI